MGILTKLYSDTPIFGAKEDKYFGFLKYKFQEECNFPTKYKVVEKYNALNVVVTKPIIQDESIVAIYNNLQTNKLETFYTCNSQILHLIGRLFAGVPEDDFNKVKLITQAKGVLTEQNYLLVPTLYNPNFTTYKSLTKACLGVGLYIKNLLGDCIDPIYLEILATLTYPLVRDTYDEYDISELIALALRVYTVCCDEIGRGKIINDIKKADLPYNPVGGIIRAISYYDAIKNAEEVAKNARKPEFKFVNDFSRLHLFYKVKAHDISQLPECAYGIGVQDPIAGKYYIPCFVATDKFLMGQVLIPSLKNTMDIMRKIYDIPGRPSKLVHYKFSDVLENPQMEVFPELALTILKKFIDYIVYSGVTCLTDDEADSFHTYIFTR